MVLCRGEPEGLHHVPQHTPGAVRDDVRHHRRPFPAISAVAVLDDLLPPVRFEVEVDVGGPSPLLGEEPFEREVEPDRVDPGEADAAAHRRVGTRPADLAEDKSPTMDTLRHGISFLKKESNISADNIILLQATTPLRRVEDIDGAISLFFDQSADAVVSGVYAPHSFNPFWAKKITDGRVQLMFESDKIVTRRQDLPEIFWHNGQIYIAAKELILSHADWYKGNCLPYVCSDETFVNIDNPQDLMLAERLILEKMDRRRPYV